MMTSRVTHPFTDLRDSEGQWVCGGAEWDWEWDWEWYMCGWRGACACVLAWGVRLALKAWGGGGLACRCHRPLPSNARRRGRTAPALDLLKQTKLHASIQHLACKISIISAMSGTRPVVTCTAHGGRRGTRAHVRKT